jgi:hypothetical protein
MRTKVILLLLCTGSACASRIRPQRRTFPANVLQTTSFSSLMRRRRHDQQRQRRHWPPAATPVADQEDMVRLLTLSAGGRQFSAIGVSAMSLSRWAAHELGDAALHPPTSCAEEEACCEESLPLGDRKTHRRLRRLWRRGDLLLAGSLTDLAKAGGLAEPARSFRRELSVLARRAQTLAPGTNESALLLNYIESSSSLASSSLRPVDGQATEASLDQLRCVTASSDPSVRSLCHRSLCHRSLCHRSLGPLTTDAATARMAL